MSLEVAMVDAVGLEPTTLRLTAECFPVLPSFKGQSKSQSHDSKAQYPHTADPVGIWLAIKLASPTSMR